jgi:type IV secretory pathway TrbL component
MAHVLRFLLPCLVLCLLGLAGPLAAQELVRGSGCSAQMPNECCPATNVAVFVIQEVGVGTVLAMVDNQQVTNASTNASAAGPAATFLGDGSAQGFAVGPTCDIGPERTTPAAGPGRSSARMPVSSEGRATKSA